MATLTGNNVSVSGANVARIRIEWQLASQDVYGNYSTINWQGYVDFFGCDAQLDNGHVNWSGVAALYNNGGRVYNYAGNFSNHTVGMGSGSFNIGHDGNGNATLSMDGSVAVYQSGTSSASGSWGLPSLARVPDVQSYGVGTITTSSAVANGNVSFAGNTGITERGIVWSTGANPTTGNNKIATGGSTGGLSATISGLSPNTTYHYRAFASNSQGTTYGADIAFTTYKVPAVTTSAPTSITGTTATANGNLTDAGNPTITEKGFVYGTSPSPTTANSKVIVAGSATGAYTGNLTGLSPSTTYYIRSYAINATGTVYGNELNFSTVVPPTVTQTAPTSVTTTTATGNANVTSNGGGALTEKGFVVSTSANPTTSDTKFVEGTTPIGAYTKAMTGLTPSTTYHIRAYAINAGGTGYSSDLTFSTDQTAPSAPTLVAPIGGVATDDLTPDFSWIYNPGSANDTQAKYQIIVTRQSDSVQMWDSGTVTSANLFATYAGTALAYNVNYQWKVRTTNQNNQVSVYSGNSIFKTSQKATVALTLPTAAQVLVTNTPTIAWTYSDPESTAQSKYQIVITDVNTGLVVLDTGLVTSAATTYPVADNILFNFGSYSITLTVYDGDGLAATPQTNAFTVLYLAPTIPGLTVNQDGAGIIQATITLSKPPVEGYYADVINLYRKPYGSLVWDNVSVNYPVLRKTLNDAEATTGWSVTGVGTAIATSTTHKYGTNSLKMGASGAGDATYTKALTGVTDLDKYDTFAAMIYVTDHTKFSSIDFKIGTDSSNYWLLSVPASEFADTAWNPVHIDRGNWTIVGNPSLTTLSTLSIIVKNATGAITAGNLLFDEIRLMKSLYQIYDYTTAAGQNLIYGANAASLTSGTSSSLATTAALEIAFTEQYINTYLVPTDTAKMLKSWMDGAKVPAWTDKTEVKYYQPMGASKPTVFVNGVQKYKEGSIELRFFDALFGGQGLLGVDLLEGIKNEKPILLRTWWGKNYYISIDGDLATVREPGIGWYVTFNFTEINP